MTEIDATTYKRIAKIEDINEPHNAIVSFINQHYRLLEKNYIEDNTGTAFELTEDSSTTPMVPDCSQIKDFYSAYDIYDKDSHSVIRRHIRSQRIANAALIGFGGLLPLW